MRLFAHWPEGSEMAAVVNYCRMEQWGWRIGIHTLRLFVVIVIPYRRSALRSFRFRVSVWPKSAFVFLNPALYFDYQSQSLIVGDRRLSLEYLELLANNYGEKVNP